MNILNVHIYPSYVRIDGYRVNHEELQATLEELYRGFTLYEVFCCWRTPLDIRDRIRGILKEFNANYSG